MPSVIEARVARARQIPFQERDLAAAVADFYLLETLGNIKGDPIAKTKLGELETKLAGEFANYLDIAVGGELRYARSMLGDDCPKELEPYRKRGGLSLLHLQEEAAIWNVGL